MKQDSDSRESPHILQVDDIILDLASREVTRRDRGAQLPRFDCDVLATFMQNVNREYSHQELYAAAGKEALKRNGSTKNVRMIVAQTIYNLRNILGEPQAILTHQGYGYRFKALTDVSEYLQFDNIILCPVSRIVMRDGKELTLSYRSFDLLAILMQQNGKLLPATELYRLSGGRFDASDKKRLLALWQ